MRIPMDSMSGRLGSRIPVHVTELSLQGISVETRSTLRPGGSYSLRLIEDGASELETKVIWCRLDRNEHGSDGIATAVYRAGLSRVVGN